MSSSYHTIISSNYRTLRAYYCALHRKYKPQGTECLNSIREGVAPERSDENIRLHRCDIGEIVSVELTIS